MDHSANRSAVPVVLVIVLFSGLGSVGKPDLASSGPFSARLHPAVSTIEPTSPASPTLPGEKIARSRADDGVFRQSLVRNQENPATGFDPFGSSDTVGTIDADIQQTAVTSDTGPIVHTIQFNNSEISEVFTVISTLSGWSIFPTVEVSKAQVTLWANGITARELLDQVVQLAGFVYHQEEDTISVMTYDEYAQHYGVSREVISLKYANPASIKSVVTPFLTAKLGKIVVHSETNALILYEMPANQEALMGIIRQLDTPTENILTKVVSLKYADCLELADILAKVFTDPQSQDKNKSQSLKQAETGRISKDTEAQKEGSTSVPFDQVSVHPVRHANQIVIVGLERDIDRVIELVSQIDIAGDDMVIEVIPLAYADVQIVGNALQAIFVGDQTNNKDKRSESNNTPKEEHRLSTETESPVEGLIVVSPHSHVEIQVIDSTNQLIVKAYRAELEKIRNLIIELDVFIEPITRNYHFIYIDAVQIYRDVERTLNMYGRSSRSSQRGQSGANASSSRGGYGGSSRENSVTLIERTNSIVLTGPPSAHRIMTTMHEGIDAPGQYESGMIEVYKIQNADVQEIANTLTELLQSQQEQEEETRRETQVRESLVEQLSSESRQMEDMQEYVPQVEAKVSVNKTTNSIVVQATARQHREIAVLIERLDIRRKQVLIKAMIVEVSSNDSMELGMEVDYVNKTGNDGGATSFGLSNLDFLTGARTSFMGTGATIAILDPTGVQGIFRALETNDNISIMSSPQVLVNDHEVGTIGSISEEPTKQTNQGETTTTTSFGEYVKAGTQFQITPHISESDYLHVQYMIDLSSFGEKADQTLPPARNTSTIQSNATIPDGHTIVVGGIQRTNDTVSVSKVPILGDLPFIGILFRKTTERKQQITTYLFITTTIMNDDEFTDLKKASTEALGKTHKSSTDQEPPKK